MIYAIFDKKAEYFFGLYPFDTDGIAVRECHTLVNSGGETPVVKYPFDFDLYSLGAYEFKTGEIVPEKKFVCNLGSLVDKKFDLSVDKESL